MAGLGVRVVVAEREYDLVPRIDESDLAVAHDGPQPLGEDPRLVVLRFDRDAAVFGVDVSPFSLFAEYGERVAFGSLGDPVDPGGGPLPELVVVDAVGFGRAEVTDGHVVRQAHVDVVPGPVFVVGDRQCGGYPCDADRQCREQYAARDLPEFLEIDFHFPFVFERFVSKEGPAPHDLSRP